jgi:hypothetical protein
MAQLIDILAVGVTGSDGDPLASGSVAFYQTGTTTLQTVYQDNAMTQAHTNPATLDAAGRLVAYTQSNLKLLIYNSAGTLVRTIENLSYHRGNVLESELADLSVTKAKINQDVAGNGLLKGSDGSLEVRVDNSTIEISSDILRVKAAGIDTSHLANDAVDADKLDEAGNYVMASVSTPLLTLTNGGASASMDCPDNGHIETTATRLTFGGGLNTSLAVDTDTLGIYDEDLAFQGTAVIDGGVDLGHGYRILTGTESVNTGGNDTVTFATAFVAAPTVVVTPTSVPLSSAWAVTATSTTTFNIVNTTGGAVVFAWIAYGRYT